MEKAPIRILASRRSAGFKKSLSENVFTTMVEDDVEARAGRKISSFSPALSVIEAISVRL